MLKQRNCYQCGISFKSYNVNPLFCSVKCRADYQAPNIDLKIAKQLYESGMTQTEIGIRLGVSQKSIHKLFKRNKYSPDFTNRRQSGRNNNNWKGKNAGYDAFHMRVIVKKGRPKKCELCGEDNPKIWYDWANLTGKFEDIEDYKRMCRKCHCQFDIKRGLKPQNKKGGKSCQY